MVVTNGLKLCKETTWPQRAQTNFWSTFSWCLVKQSQKIWVCSGKMCKLPFLSNCLFAISPFSPSLFQKFSVTCLYNLQVVVIVCWFSRFVTNGLACVCVCEVTLQCDEEIQRIYIPFFFHLLFLFFIFQIFTLISRIWSSSLYFYSPCTCS